MAFFTLLVALGLSGLTSALAQQVFCPSTDKGGMNLTGAESHSGGFIFCAYELQKSPCSCFLVSALNLAFPSLILLV
jgi:hypothetical protein